MEEKQLLSYLKYSFFNLLKKDNKLINIDVYEPSISTRIAMYLREKLKRLENDFIFVDVEYNKYGLEDKKRCIQNNIDSDCIRPDILIHERTNQNNNILYCEVKKNSNSDDKKVKEQVKDKKYQFGISIEEIKLQFIKFKLFINKNGFISDIKYKYDYIKNQIIKE